MKKKIKKGILSISIWIIVACGVYVGFNAIDKSYAYSTDNFIYRKWTASDAECPNQFTVKNFKVLNTVVNSNRKVYISYDYNGKYNLTDVGIFLKNTADQYGNFVTGSEIHNDEIGTYVLLKENSFDEMFTIKDSATYSIYRVEFSVDVQEQDRFCYYNAVYEKSDSEQGFTVTIDNDAPDYNPTPIKKEETQNKTNTENQINTESQTNVETKKEKDTNIQINNNQTSTNVQEKTEIKNETTIVSDKKNYNYTEISDEVINKIKNASDNETIIVTNNNISKEVFEAIKGTNKQLVIKSGDNEIIFNGYNISETKDIDTGINITNIDSNKNINKLVKNGVIIDFADNGILPAEAIVRIKIPDALTLSEQVLAYYYNAELAKFKLISDSITKTEEGYYEFTINHNSSYVLVDTKLDDDITYEEEDMFVTSKEKNVETTKNNSTKLIIIISSISLGALSVIIALLIIKNKKNSNKKVRK